MNILEQNAGIFICVLFFLGLLVGSFLNVVVYRLPIMLDRMWRSGCEELLSNKEDGTFSAKETEPFNLFFPPSACPNCKTPIKAWQNIPLVSYFILLRGKCHHCKYPISMRYPLVELLTGCLFAAVAWRFGYGYQAAAGCIFTAFLVAMTFIDADTQLLPDTLTLPLLWLGLLLSCLFSGHGLFVTPVQAIVGAAIGYLSLWSIYWLFKLLTKREGMGYGDFKLLAALGAWLGAPALLIVVLISSVAGLLYALLSSMGLGKKMPYGPYLAVGGWIALLFGRLILNWMYPGVMLY